VVTLRTQKRLAADILKCGKKRVWMDPNEISELGMANSRANVRKLIKDGAIIRKPIQIRTRYRWRKMKEAKAKGRHSGVGKRRGTADARNPSKTQWMKRMRILRRVLKKYRNSGKIDKHTYHKLYLKVKGNGFKAKKNLMEQVFKLHAEKLRENKLKEQLAAKKEKQSQLKQRYEARMDRKSKKVIQEAEEAAKLVKKTEKK
jgi:large subunit ribosomal protein L19e